MMLVAMGLTAAQKSETHSGEIIDSACAAGGSHAGMKRSKLALN
jgi:hypothetical protein